MSTAAAWRWCLVAGVATALAGVGFGAIPGLVPCGPSGGLHAILAFELARSPAELARLFGAEPCRSALIAAQDRALLLDSLAFVPGYTIFLAAAAMALDGRWFARMAILAALFAGLLDEVENALLHHLLATLPGSPAIITLLYWETRTKFVLLAGVGLVLAGLLTTNRRLGAAMAIPIAIGAVFSLWFAATDMHAPQMMIGYAISWAALLLVAGIGALFPRAFSRAP